jgi:peptidoglycan/LPS O-acetylase OafA/YrhL
MSLLLSQFLEACRWLGALVVLLVHATNLFVNQADIMSASHGAAAYVWWFFSAFELGHQAVVGFFVMSGYLVGGAVLAHLRKRQDYLREYFIHRVTRIYLVLAPAVALTFLLDSFGRRFLAGGGVYDWPLFNGHFSTALFFGSMLNLQGIVFDYFGTNGPLWSLACEFWYYVTFPLLLMPFAPVYSAPARIRGFAIGCAIFGALSIPQSWFVLGYGIWAMGAFATRAPRPLVRSRWLALALYAAVVIFIRLVVRGPQLLANPWMSPLADLVGAALFLNVILAFRDGPKEGFSFLRFEFHKRLADFSFSLYSIHLPILILARSAVAVAMGRDWASEVATPMNYAVAAIVMSATCLAAYGFSRVTEARTGDARRALRRLLDRIAPVEAATPATDRVGTGS